MTPAQLQRFGDELEALFDRYRTIGAGDPAARRIHVTTHAAPIDPTPPAGVEAENDRSESTPAEPAPAEPTPAEPAP